MKVHTLSLFSPSQQKPAALGTDCSVKKHSERELDHSSLQKCNCLFATRTCSSDFKLLLIVGTGGHKLVQKSLPSSLCKGERKESSALSCCNLIKPNQTNNKKPNLTRKTKPYMCIIASWELLSAMKQLLTHIIRSLQITPCNLWFLKNLLPLLCPVLTNFLSHLPPCPKHILHSLSCCKFFFVSPWKRKN